jgi:hypothetical protein
MKKIVTLLAVATVGFFYACGPSAEELALKEKQKNDSILAANEKAKREQDSLALIMRNDSIAAAAAEADSLANAAAAKGGVKKPTTPTKTKDEKNLDKINNLKGGSESKTPAEQKKDEQNIKEIKKLKGGN